MASTLTEVQERIERLSRQRQALWADPDSDKADIPYLSQAIADAYEEKRCLHASAGTPEKRAQVVRRARIEHELERLIDSSTARAARAAPASSAA